jgi:hypothetical protein
MDISIGSYKCRIEICILILIVAWFLFAHLFCSCSRVGMMEGFEIGKQLYDGIVKKEKFGNKNKKNKKEKFGIRDERDERREGFKNISTGFSFANSNENTYYKDPNTWSSPNLVYSSGAASSSGINSILNRPKQPIPLPEGELNMFATTKFKPECCPNTYSTGSGCACMTIDQYKYLRNRGSNNVPFSEY